MKNQKINDNNLILNVNQSDEKEFFPLFVAAQNGHTQIVDILGNNNTLDIHQSGLNSQILEINHIGSDTTFTIIQSDGYYNTADITPPLNSSSSWVYLGGNDQP